MNSQQRSKLERLMGSLRKHAIRAGVYDPAWDLAYDIEGVLRGLPSLSIVSIEEMISQAQQILDE